MKDRTQSPESSSSRARRALELVESGAVRLPADYYEACIRLMAEGAYAEVASQTDPRFTYRVNGVCGCSDYARVGGPCKHLLAVDLALAVMKAHEEADEEGWIAQAEAATGIRHFCPSCGQAVWQACHPRRGEQYWVCRCGWSGDWPRPELRWADPEPPTQPLDPEVDWGLRPDPPRRRRLPGGPGSCPYEVRSTRTEGCADW